MTRYIVVAFVILTNVAFGQIQCTNDVVILQGTSISMCEDDLQTISGSDGFSSYAWTGPETQSGQSITPNFSGDYIIAAMDGVGCISQDTITVIINPSPTVEIVSSEGDPLCPSSSGTVLSTTDSYISYTWNTGATSATLFVTTAATYTVDVVDQNACSGTGSITLTSYTFDLEVIDNGPCGGGTTTLAATGGSTFLWSTGETGSQIIVAPTDATVYSVTITADACSTELSTLVVPNEFNYELVDTLFLFSGDKEVIEGPDGFSDYLWSPAANIDNSIAQDAVYHASSSEWVFLQANYQGLCTYTDSVYILVIDLTIPGGFSPNGDNKNQYFVIPELAFFDASIDIWNRWGDLVYQSENYENDWNGTCQAGLCIGDGSLPEGTYFYEIDIRGKKVRGYVIIKR